MILSAHTARMWQRMDLNPRNSAPKFGALSYKVNIYNKGESSHGS